MMTVQLFDERRVADVWEVYFSAIHGVCKKDYNPQQLAAWAPETFDLALYAEKLRQLQPLMILLDEKVVAYGDLQDDGLIDHFFVHGGYQARGVGHLLMVELLGRGQGLPQLYANVSMTARPFFARYHFQMVREQQILVRGCSLKNYRMVRTRDGGNV